MSAGHGPPRRMPLRNRQYYLAELLAVFEALVGIGGAFERHDGINHGLEQAALEQLEDRIQLRLAAHE